MSGDGDNFLSTNTPKVPMGSGSGKKQALLNCLASGNKSFPQLSKKKSGLLTTDCACLHKRRKQEEESRIRLQLLRAAIEIRVLGWEAVGLY
jgi:hypothetical protein